MMTFQLFGMWTYIDICLSVYSYDTTCVWDTVQAVKLLGGETVIARETCIHLKKTPVLKCPFALTDLALVTLKCYSVGI